VLLTFHGFGQNAGHYKSFAEKSKDSCTIYSFDLFFHGDSVWADGDKPLTKRKFGTVMADFLKENNIDKYSAAGFSLGAKFALTLYELFPGKVEELILIAPEGIRVNIWYKIATELSITRKLFKYIVTHPGLLFWLAKVISNIGMINPKMATFALKQMEYGDNRIRVYHSWVVFRKLRTKVSHLSELIRKYGTKVTVYLGSLDKVITSKSVRALVNKVPDQVDVKVVKSDHSRLLEAVAMHLYEER